MCHKGEDLSLERGGATWARINTMKTWIRSRVHLYKLRLATALHPPTKNEKNRARRSHPLYYYIPSNEHLSVVSLVRTVPILPRITWSGARRVKSETFHLRNDSLIVSEFLNRLKGGFALILFCFSSHMGYQNVSYQPSNFMNQHP